MSSEPYPQPVARVRAEWQDRGSRFLATADRAETAEAARAVLDEIRAEMPDASHHCYAFAAGFGPAVTEGMSDDGEPSGTAGRPILAVVRGSGIGDLIVVVTRYFGGTKLGTGGLVRAYTAAAQAVLAELPTEIKVARVDLEIRLPYAAFERLQRALDARGAEVLETRFETDVWLRCRLPEAEEAGLRDELQGWTAGEARVERAGPPVGDG